MLQNKARIFAGPACIVSGDTWPKPIAGTLATLG